MALHHLMCNYSILLKTSQHVIMNSVISWKEGSSHQVTDVIIAESRRIRFSRFISLFSPVQLFLEIIDAFLLRGDPTKRAHTYRSNTWRKEAVNINASLRDVTRPTDRMSIVSIGDRMGQNGKEGENGVHERSSIRNREYIPATTTTQLWW